MTNFSCVNIENHWFEVLELKQMIWSRYRRYESRAADRLIFPTNPGGSRSPSHDHDGLEARLGNDHATSRPSLLPNNVGSAVLRDSEPGI